MCVRVCVCVHVSTFICILKVGGIEYCITGMIIHSYTVIITNTASIKTVKTTVVKLTHTWSKKQTRGQI